MDRYLFSVYSNPRAILAWLGCHQGLVTCMPLTACCAHGHPTEGPKAGSMLASLTRMLQVSLDSAPGRVQTHVPGQTRLEFQCPPPSPQPHIKPPKARTDSMSQSRQALTSNSIPSSPAKHTTHQSVHKLHHPSPKPCMELTRARTDSMSQGHSSTWEAACS